MLALDESFHRQNPAPRVAVCLNLNFLFESQDGRYALEATANAVSNYDRIALKCHCNPVWRSVIPNYPQWQIPQRSLLPPMIKSAIGGQRCPNLSQTIQTNQINFLARIPTFVTRSGDSIGMKNIIQV